MLVVAFSSSFVCSEMENERKLNVLSILDKVRLIRLVEKYEIANEFNIPSNTLSSIIKQEDKILKFNYGNMKKNEHDSLFEHR